MTGAAPPTVVIADDHAPTRLGVRMALMRGGFTVVAECADCDGAVSAVLRTAPDVCLLDVSMPGGGIEAARRLADHGCSTAIVMLTASERTDDVLAALRAGAVGFLPKDISPERLPAAIAGVLKGEAALPRALVGVVLNQLRDFTAPAEQPIRVGSAELSSRESEVLRLLRAGMTTAEIGTELSLSPITVRRHISGGAAKLGAGDRHEALRAIDAAA